MSDISKKIFSIDPEPDEEPIALVPEPVEDELSSEAADVGTDSPQTNGKLGLRTVVDIPTTLFRPIIELVEPADDDIEDHAPADAELNEPPITVMRLDQIIPSKEEVASNTVAADMIAPVRPVVVAPSYDAPTRLGWIGPLLAVLTVIGVGALAYAYIQDAQTVSPIGLAGLIMAAFVSTATVLALWASLRTLGQTQTRSMQLAEIADRLTRADQSVTEDITNMSSAIRRELAQVDSRMAQSRAELDTLVAQITRQSADMDGKTRLMVDRTESIARAMTDHRDAFSDLSSTFETQMSTLADTVDRHRGQLASVSDAAVEQVGAAMDGLDRATQQTSERSSSLSDIAKTAEQIFTDAEGRLSIMSDKISERAAELDRVYERQAEHLASLDGQLSGETTAVETALAKQTDQLSAIDAQIEITEGRLTALLDHARGIQAQLTARLSDIDSTMSESDTRSKAFTADIADRVSDSVAQTRRELSIMEGELRALQSRMDGAKALDLGLEVPDTKQPSPSGRLHLKPLDSDFPPVEPEDLAIPELPEDQTLDLIEPLDLPMDTIQPQPSAPTLSDLDLVRRPGEEAPSGRMFGRSKKDEQDKEDWRWRDMLGSMDPITRDTPSRGNSRIDRPPPGVPLSPPPPTPKLPDGSDVVARLCEVKLAPSAVVDQGTIIDATEARREGGETAQSEAVFSRLNAPVIHLRGVLSADLEFRLRAEGFRRNFDTHLQTQRDQTKIRAELGTASGRAYLLCAAALMTS
ncbi:hypothetical protein GCM10007853_09530 [Algimonas ampicilliniresistens]|uniref:Uncharacterized protein n=1 Tax=Algimonas ampicilliniresistens TaxID=1298735 RepID=A0ABQ5V7X5_9PROT|nr:hypothetical protein [Algimonas ampicilliniresistens]GLQ23079.1 hypothetical protein GCM10007853_09530 [Algimonas ampicilliniresistens]